MQRTDGGYGKSLQCLYDEKCDRLKALCLTQMKQTEEKEYT